MPRYFTHYWANDTWHRNIKDDGRSCEGDPLEHIAGNQFHSWNIEEDDFIYVITVQTGELYVLGRMQVGMLCSLAEAAIHLHRPQRELWQADEHILVKQGSGTPMRFEGKVPLVVTQRLQFERKGSRNPQPPKFDAPGHIDQQTLRGVCELTEDSAAELDKLIKERERRR